MTGFQIGQCRIRVDVERTKDYYETLHRISYNCKCSDCSYFENEVTRKNIRLFDILKKMGVDLTRQPNINPDGVCSVGPKDKFNKAYLAYYQVYGQLGKTQRKTQTKDEQGKLVSVDFYEPEEDSYIQYKIKQDTDDRLIIDFYLECEKK